MIDLDDEASLAACDPSGMLEIVGKLGAHVRDGYARGLAAEDLPSGDGVTSIVFCGMGSSAVPGEVVRALFRERLVVPVDVCMGSILPEYCGPRTLVVAASFSGGTAETLACAAEAIERGCRVLFVASGGELLELARAHGLSTVTVPKDFPAPRASMGWLTSAVLGALESIGILPTVEADVQEAAHDLDVVAQRLAPSVGRIDNPAKELAWQIGHRVPVIWGAEGFAAVAASRWKTQCNENAKVPAWWSSLPELDHNEVVGWAPGQGERFFVVALRHEGEAADVSVRFPPSIELVVESGAVAEEVWAAGRSKLARLYSLVQMGDFVSVYHGLAHGIDPTPIEAIARLKRTLEGAS